MNFEGSIDAIRNWYFKCNLSGVFDIPKSVVEFKEPETRSVSDHQRSLSIRSEKYESTLHSGVMSILAEVIEQLIILSNVFKEQAEFRDVKLIEYKSLKERFEAQAKDVFGDYRISAKYTNFHKIRTEISLLLVMLTTLNNELHKTGTFATLSTFNFAITEMENEENKLLHDITEKQKLLKALRNSYEKETKQSKGKIEELKNEIHTLTDEYELILHFCKEEMKYTKKWESTRNEQNNIILSSQENHYSSIIDDTAVEIDLETRCYEEIVRFLEEARDDYMDEIQYWMKAYDEKIDEMDTKICNIKMDQEKLTEDHQKLIEDYNRQQEEIKSWLEYKAVKQAKEEREALENYAATRIQAWWRGVMYRRKLGPYRKKKGKDKKGKDKKGKKKK